MRIATQKDLDSIVSIYNSTIFDRTATADLEPVSVESKLDWFRNHDPNTRPILVYENNDIVEAWVSFQSFYGRPAYAGTAEISIYIKPECRGRGLGKTLLAQSLDMTPQLGIKTVLGFIFSHNQASLKLFQSFEFDIWGKLPDIASMDGTDYSLFILGKRVNP